MWRAMFLAFGAYTCLLGAQIMAIEKATVKRPNRDNPQGYITTEIVPPDWAPWSLMAGGVVVAIYSFTLPKKVGS